jgi:hypothetical protein
MVHEIIRPPVQEIELQAPGTPSPPSLSLNRNDHFDSFYFSENEREEAAVACTLNRSEDGRTGGALGTRLRERKAPLLDEGTRARKGMRLHTHILFLYTSHPVC